MTSTHLFLRGARGHRLVHILFSLTYSVRDGIRFDGAARSPSTPLQATCQAHVHIPPYHILSPPPATMSSRVDPRDLPRRVR